MLAYSGRESGPYAYVNVFAPWPVACCPRLEAPLAVGLGFALVCRHFWCLRDLKLVSCCPQIVVHSSRSYVSCPNFNLGSLAMIVESVRHVCMPDMQLIWLHSIWLGFLYKPRNIVDIVIHWYDALWVPESEAVLAIQNTFPPLQVIFAWWLVMIYTACLLCLNVEHEIYRATTQSSQGAPLTIIRQKQTKRSRML